MKLISILVAIATATSCTAQTALQWGLQQKNTGAGYTTYWATAGNDYVFATNGSGIWTPIPKSTFLTPAGDGSGLTGLVSSQITDASSGDIGGAAADKVAKFDGMGALSAQTLSAQGLVANLDGLSISNAASMTGVIKATDLTTSQAFELPNASGTLALTTSNVATATTLAIPRAIYGNNFNGSAALTQVIASTYGGTGNGFAKFSGPATSEKTFTLPNTSATILTDNTAVTVAQGGTGRTTSTTAYGLLAAGTTATGAHQTLDAGATTDILVGGGASALPVWTTATGSGAPVRQTSPTVSGLTATGITTAANLYLPNNGVSSINGIDNASNNSAGLWFSSYAIYISGYSGIVFRSSAASSQFQTERMRITPAGGVSIGTTTDAGATNLLVAGIIKAGDRVRLKGYTVTALNALASPAAGDTAYVTDALAPTFGTALVGGGTVVAKAFYNGTAWINE